MIINKSEFLKSLNEEEFNSGMFRVFIEEDDKIQESLWAYQPKDGDKSFAILANTPVSYFPVLYWGVEIKLKYRDGMAILDNEWIEKELNRYMSKPLSK